MMDTKSLVTIFVAIIAAATVFWYLVLRTKSQVTVTSPSSSPTTTTSPAQPSPVITILVSVKQQ